MIIEQMKTCLLQIEATRHNTETRANLIQRTEPQTGTSQQSTGDIKCYRCNKMGHWKSDCPLKTYSLWFCYVCNLNTDHKGDNCPNKIQRYEPIKNNSNINTLNRGKGSGRGKFRGRVNKVQSRYYPYDKRKTNLLSL